MSIDIKPKLKDLLNKQAYCVLLCLLRTKCVTPSPENSYIEGLIPFVTVFGDSSCERVIKVK